MCLYSLAGGKEEWKMILKGIYLTTLYLNVKNSPKIFSNFDCEILGKNSVL